MVFVVFDLVFLLVSQGFGWDGRLRNYIYCTAWLLSVLWRYCLGGRKGIQPVKTEWWGAGVVICLERDADLYMAQLMPLPLTVSCFYKIQIDFTFLVPAHPGGPGKGPINGCVCWVEHKTLTQSATVLSMCVCSTQRLPSRRPVQQCGKFHWQHLWTVGWYVGQTPMFTHCWSTSCRGHYPREFAEHFSLCLQCFDTVGWAVRKSIRPVKNWVMRCWCDYLSGVRSRLFAYGPADATAIHKTPSSLASFKSRLEKRPLNACSSSSSQRLWSYDLMALYRSVYYYLLLLLLFLSTSYELSVWIDDAGWLVSIYERSDVSESVRLSVPSVDSGSNKLLVCCFLAVSRCLPLSQPGRWQQILVANYHRHQSSGCSQRQCCDCIRIDISIVSE